MSEHSRNLAVGLTVLAALAILGGMILLFAGLPEAFQTGWRLNIQAPTTYDAHEGDPVYLAGLRVGRITDIRFTDPADPGRGVTLAARIERDIRLPGNTKAYFYTRGLVGAAYIEFGAEGPLPVDESGRAIEYLPEGATVPSVHRGSGLLPEELTPALKNLSELAANLNRLIAPAPEEVPPTAPGATAPTQPPGLQVTLDKLNRALDALAGLGDERNQANLRASLENLSKASAAATDAMDALKAFAKEATQTALQAKDVIRGADDAVKAVSQAAQTSRQRIDDLARKLIENADKVSDLMTSVNRTALKVESGEGTLGRLVNDSGLYNDLQQATEAMAALLKDFRELVELWKERGVEIKLKR